MTNQNILYTVSVLPTDASPGDRERCFLGLYDTYDAAQQAATESENSGKSKLPRIIAVTFDTQEISNEDL